MSTRAIIVDDHPVIRSALVTSLLSLRVFDEVETATSFRELLDMLGRDAGYQMMILDLSLEDISHTDGAVYIREHFPDILILVFSANDTTDIIAECFEHGVHGFVSKSASMQVFVNAVRMVLAGSIYIPPGAARLMGFEPPELQESPRVAEEQIRLTPKQREVFDQMMLGVPNKIIARRLEIAEGTVKTHLHVIYQILRVNNRAQAILKSRQIQIV